MARTARLGSSLSEPGNIQPGYINQTGLATLTWIGPFNPAELMEGGDYFQVIQEGVPFQVSSTLAAEIVASDPSWWRQS